MFIIFQTETSKNYSTVEVDRRAWNYHILLLQNNDVRLPDLIIKSSLKAKIVNIFDYIIS